MTKPTLDEIIEVLAREALDMPAEGWLSNLSQQRLEFDPYSQEIEVGWNGEGIDIGHLAGIVDSMIQDAVKDALVAQKHGLIEDHGSGSRMARG